MPRAFVPNIRLESPKITRKLTTEWFAKRVDERYERCLARGRSRLSCAIVAHAVRSLDHES